MPPFLLVVALMFLLLMFRRPDSILNPQFWAEDASIFFKDQLQLGLACTLFHDYMGYLHFVPRLVASFASWFPVVHAPFIYNFCATALAAVLLSLFALPAYRYLIAPDYLRLAACAIAAGLCAASEVLGTITDSQWYLAIGALLLLVYPLPEKWADSWMFQLLSGGLAIIVACTSPQIILFLPLVLWKLYPFHRKRCIGPLLAVAGIMMQAFVILSLHGPEVPEKSRPLVQLAAVTLGAPVYRSVMADFLGVPTSILIGVHASTFFNLGVIALFLLWLVWLFRTSTGPVRWSVAVSAYVMFASVAMVAIRRPYGDSFDFSGAWTDWGRGRYAVLPSALVVYLVALTLQKLVGRRGGVVTVSSLVALSAYGLQDHYRVPAFDELYWTNQAEQIESWIRGTEKTGAPGGLMMRFNPTPVWTMYLPARLSPASPQSPWEGCLLRGQSAFGRTHAVYWIDQGIGHSVSVPWIKSRGLRWDEDVRAFPQSKLDALPKAP